MAFSGDLDAWVIAGIRDNLKADYDIEFPEAADPANPSQYFPRIGSKIVVDASPSTGSNCSFEWDFGFPASRIAPEAVIHMCRIWRLKCLLHLLSGCLTQYDKSRFLVRSNVSIVPRAEARLSLNQLLDNRKSLVVEQH